MKAAEKINKTHLDLDKTYTESLELRRGGFTFEQKFVQRKIGNRHKSAEEQGNGGEIIHSV
ncbi:hypothetical protein GCM10007422_04000 [Pedobacter zeae]|uniref:Uncharacterized protein n=1 Tax=Pedobacter zeae TaxID=1737356 RepID=A0ABQ1XHT1_9SPHI|nr:hypothetical protein GCM10007422_04000 [Pedobacter zeae]